MYDKIYNTPVAVFLLLNQTTLFYNHGNWSCSFITLGKVNYSIDSCGALSDQHLVLLLIASQTNQLKTIYFLPSYHTMKYHLLDIPQTSVNCQTPSQFPHNASYARTINLWSHDSHTLNMLHTAELVMHTILGQLKLLSCLHVRCCDIYTRLRDKIQLQYLYPAAFLLLNQTTFVCNHGNCSSSLITLDLIKLFLRFLGSSDQHLVLLPITVTLLCLVYVYTWHDTM